MLMIVMSFINALIPQVGVCVFLCVSACVFTAADLRCSSFLLVVKFLFSFWLFPDL